LTFLRLEAHAAGVDVPETKYARSGDYQIAQRWVPLLAPSAQGIDALYVHHDAHARSSISVPFVPVDRVPPAAPPPSGAGFTDPLGAICTALSLPC